MTQNIKRTTPFIAFVALTALLNAQDIPTVKIGQQEWMVKNLDVVTFRNGDTIPEAKTDEEWKKAGTEGKPAWCYYNNDPKNGKKYGKLYNWYAVNDTRGLAPKRYHVPSKKEWNVLVETLGGDTIASKKLKSAEGWRKDSNGTNESGFSGLPGGFRNYKGRFPSTSYYGNWWSSTENDELDAWYYELNLGGDFYNEGFGLSVRCLKN